MNKTKPNTHKRMLVTLIAAISLWTFLIGLTKPASQTPLLGFSAVAATLEQEAAETTPTTEAPESELLTQLLEMTSEYASNYGLTPEMTDQELANVYLSLDSERSYAAWTELNEMVALSEGMTAAEIHLLLEHPTAQLCDRLYAIIYQINTPVTVATIDHSPLEGIHITGSSNGESDSMSYDASAGTVTIAIKGKDGACGSGKTATATITIQNTSTSRATISFGITKTTVKSLTASTGTLTENSFSVTLAANATATLTMTTEKNDTVNTVVFSNFQHEPVASNAKVTVTYDTQKGSVTLGGASVPNGGSATAIGGTLTAAAAPASGCSFLGWINADTGERLSPDASTTLDVLKDMNIQAVFVTTASDTAWFMVDNKWLSNDLNAAAQLGKKVVLMNNGTLSASTSSDGVYTIPSGVTLLIPYDAAGTLCTTRPSYHENAYTAPTVFRTLTMADGANITVNGAISVASTISSKQDYAGMPSGPYGHIKMESGSKITVESNATLYAWGYITGSGSVEVKSSGKVYECFQVTSFRGGDVTSKMTSKADTYGVFPFNQYYVQNVEVPMTLHSGATETGLAYIYVTLAGVQTMELPFIGNVDGSSMFVINSGYVVKDYLEGTGRTKIQVYGDLSVTEISVSMKISLLGSVTIDTSKYALPIPHHFTISLESGNITMNQTMAFLPGSELYIGEGTTCTLGSKKKIYVYDLDQWLYNDGANGYSGIPNKPYMSLPYVPGGNGTTGRLKDTLVQIDGTVDATAGSVYVTAGGANIYSTGTGVAKVTPGTDTKTYQVIQNDRDVSSWPEIPILPAILQDADGTDVSTGTAGDYTYYASTGRWCTPTHRYSDGEVIAPTCTDEGCTKYTCIACGHFYTEAPVDALGHTPAAAVQENINPATCFEPGSYDSVVYCDVCGEEISRTPTVIPVLEHNYVDGFCEHCKQPKVTFTVLHNLALRQEVQIGYWIQVETAAQVAETGILIWDEATYLAEDQHDINSTEAVKPTMTSRQGYMMGYGEGIRAQNLDTVYYAIPYIKTTDEKYYYAKNADKYAAPDYATEMSGTSATVQAVVRDLLNFGTNAKNYFTVRDGKDINALTPINSVLPEESRVLSYTDSMKVTGITPQKNTSATMDCKWRYSTAELEESFHLNHFADENTAFTQMLYWDEDDYASAAEPLSKASATRSDLAVTSRNMGSDSEPDMTSVAKVDKIFAKDLYDWQYVCMYNSADDSYGPIRADSVAAYLTRKMNQIEGLSAEKKTTADSYLYETCKAMLAYGTSAKAYANE